MIECECEEGWVEPKRFRAIDLIGLAAHTAGKVVQAVADGLEGLSDIVAQHANWLDNQDEFAEDAAREIESLISGEHQEDPDD